MLAVAQPSSLDIKMFLANEAVVEANKSKALVENFILGWCIRLLKFRCETRSMDLQQYLYVTADLVELVDSAPSQLSSSHAAVSVELFVVFV